MMNETEIISKVLLGNDGYEQLVERYHVGLIIHCERITNNRQDAEDIAQEAFVTAYFKLRDYNGSKASFSTWLYRIATNLAIDHLRKMKQTISVDDIEAIAAVTMPARIENERKAEIRQAVISLVPPEYRKVVEAYYWDGKSYKEVAAQLGVPINTVRTWLRRAKLQLQEKLV